MKTIMRIACVGCFIGMLVSLVASMATGLHPIIGGAFVIGTLITLAAGDFME